MMEVGQDREACQYASAQHNIIRDESTESSRFKNSSF